MKLLASRNIVTIRQGSGTYIASSPGMVDDPLGFTFIGNKQKLINDLLEVRFLLEPPIAAMAATRADKKDIKKITALCDEVEDLLKKHEDHTQKDIDFHAAIALSSKNVVVPRLVPVINSSIPLFVETTRGTLLEETIETHREIADAIAAHDPLRAQDAMYLHLVYNRKRISARCASQFVGDSPGCDYTFILPGSLYYKATWQYLSKNTAAPSSSQSDVISSAARFTLSFAFPIATAI